MPLGEMEVAGIVVDANGLSSFLATVSVLAMAKHCPQKSVFTSMSLRR